MAIYKCKMCGANLEVKENAKICTCDYCGTSQTISLKKDDETLKKYARGTALRNDGEFDKAYSIFESLVNSDEVEAETYWNLLLCKYGITYVDDYDGNKKPSINRMSMDLFTDDNDYKKMLEVSDVVTKKQYIEEAKVIDSIQKEIIEIVNKEEPYDIFISYKETDEFGDRTKDSLLAYEIYDELTKKGYKVFLSRITLSHVAGQAYEPYIYSALYTSKCMILLTTNEDYINTVWVKNEWSRFLGMMKKDKTKKIIPCYQDIDPYDLPKEIRNIQCLDMGKLGFIQDLILGIDKIFNNNSKKIINSNDVDNTLTRLDILINDDLDFEKAEPILEESLLKYPTCGKLYEYALLINNEISESELEKSPIFLENDLNYKKILKYGDKELKDKYIQLNESSLIRLEKIACNINEYNVDDLIYNINYAIKMALIIYDFRTYDSVFIKKELKSNSEKRIYDALQKLKTNLNLTPLDIPWRIDFNKDIIVRYKDYPRCIPFNAIYNVDFSFGDYNPYTVCEIVIYYEHDKSTKSAVLIEDSLRLKDSMLKFINYLTEKNIYTNFYSEKKYSNFFEGGEYCKKVVSDDNRPWIIGAVIFVVIVIILIVYWTVKDF